MRPEANPDFEAIRRLVAQWRAVAPYWFGDYYPLTPYSLSSEAWVAWQFDRPDLGGGVVQAFRRPDCAQESITVRLRGLDPRARYRLRDLDEASFRVVTGQELMQGLRISAPARPFAVVLHYERLRR
jgi:alpha-galactosidase